MITRRDFIGTLAGGLLAAPLAGEAQQVSKVYRVGLIFTTSPVSVMAGRQAKFVWSRPLGY